MSNDPVDQPSPAQQRKNTGKDPEIIAVKNNQTEDAPFNFTDLDIIMRTCNVEVPDTNEEMKDFSLFPVVSNSPSLTKTSRGRRLSF